ncbi:rod shape-determining protein MreD [Aliibacillus thermotolerans]|uniref:Rod shape-determining protein MreD n=1 Tax=Aliibacillus thermotolerans TaxID=1834418 RepID=A0ABW0U5Z3_9BACI|nr:rod shape-determining protein MreD [Aliibacillus thermotolerans]MDA3129267.1 rod shape-determining protein MreD [Aliibacillus thermotolerans]
MIRFVLPFLLFLLFIIEGTWFQIFIPFHLDNGVVLVPRFTLIAVVLIAIYRGAGSGIMFGVLVGVLYDFVYNELIGVYMFSFGLTAYISSFTIPAVRHSNWWQMLIVFCAIFIFEWLTYGLYYLIDYTDIYFEQFFVMRLLPSWILNGVVAIVLLYPARLLFQKLETYEELEQR